MNSILVDLKFLKTGNFHKYFQRRQAKSGQPWNVTAISFMEVKSTLYAVSFGFSTIPCRGLFVGEREKK